MITGIILPFSINSAILHAKLTARATEKSYLQIKQKISPFPSDKYYFGGYLFFIYSTKVYRTNIFGKVKKKVVLSSRWRRLGI
jgi:hypothetical protein